MKYKILIALLLLSLSLFSQSRKSGTTRAVVIGISDYQDEDIPDLQYAHKDAEAFVAYLQSTSGENLKKDQIKLLTNKDATTGQIGAALEWLVEQSQEGDRSIIYFSGHGDVENKTMFNLGYLLTWNSPPKTYMAGALPLNYLQAIVSTLSTQNKSEVVLITDACRAGKLAGRSVNGTQLTNANLAKQFANEVKILSCQPHEFSIEGEQWGGGRGAFSYHLIDGLYGMADKDDDLKVKLMEIDRYLEDHVTAETDPHSQIPMVVGSKSAMLSFVDEDFLTTLKEQRSRELPQLFAVENRSVADLLFADLDSSLLELYDTFTAQVEAGNLLDPKGESAYDLYLTLVEKEELQPLHGSIRRNLAAALQDESQEAINEYLKADPVELNKRYSNEKDYDKYPRYIEKAAEILGEKNFFYSSLLAKANYFKGLQSRLQADQFEEGDSTIYVKAIDQQNTALAYQPNAPYILNELGVLHTRLKEDSIAFNFYKQAIEISPEWGLPYVNYSIGLYYTGNFEKAIEMGEKAGKLLGNFPEVYSFLAWINASNWSWKDEVDLPRKGTELNDDFEYEWDEMNSYGQNKVRLEQSLEYLQNAIELDSSYANSFYYKGGLLHHIGDYKGSIESYRRYIDLKPNDDKGYGMIIGPLSRLRKYSEAEVAGKTAIKLSTEYKPIWYGNLGYLYRQWQKYDLSIEYCIKALKIQNDRHDYINIGCSYRALKKIKEGEIYMLQSITNSKNGFDHPFVYFFNGWLYYDSGSFVNYKGLNRYDDAMWFLLKSIEMKPNYPDPHFELGKMYQKQRMYLQSVLAIEKGMAIAKDDPTWGLSEIGPAYFYSGQKEKAESAFKKIADKYPSYNNSVGWFYKNHGEFELAKKYLLAALDSKQTHHGIYANLAVLHLDQQMFKEATEYIEEGLKINPKSSLLNSMYTSFSPMSYDSIEMQNILQEKKEKYPQILLYNKFAQLYKNGNFEEAIKIKEPIIGSNLEIFYIIALLEVGKLEEAESIIKQKTSNINQCYNLLAKHPSLEPLRQTYTCKKYLRRCHPQKFNDLGQYKFELPEPIYFPENCIHLAELYQRHNEWTRAEFLYHKAMELRPDNDSAYIALNKLYENHPDVAFEKSEKALTKLIKENPKNPDHYLSLAILSSFDKKNKTTVKNYNKAIALSKAPKKIMHLLGNYHIAANQYKEAKIVFDKIATSDISEPIEFHDLAIAYFKINDEDGYKAIIEKGMEKFTSSNELYKMSIGFANDLNESLLTYSIEKGMEKFPNDSGLFYNNACLFSLANNEEKAIQQLESAIQKGYTNYDHMQKDSDLNNIRESSAFKTLIKKHFPDKHKD